MTMKVFAIIIIGIGLTLAKTGLSHNEEENSEFSNPLLTGIAELGFLIEEPIERAIVEITNIDFRPEDGFLDSDKLEKITEEHEPKADRFILKRRKRITDGKVLRKVEDPMKHSFVIINKEVIEPQEGEFTNLNLTPDINLQSSSIKMKGRRSTEPKKFVDTETSFDDDDDAFDDYETNIDDLIYHHVAIDKEKDIDADHDFWYRFNHKEDPELAESRDALKEPEETGSMNDTLNKDATAKAETTVLPSSLNESLGSETYQNVPSRAMGTEVTTQRAQNESSIRPTEILGNKYFHYHPSIHRPIHSSADSVASHSILGRSLDFVKSLVPFLKLSSKNGDEINIEMEIAALENEPQTDMETFPDFSIQRDPYEAVVREKRQMRKRRQIPEVQTPQKSAKSHKNQHKSAIVSDNKHSKHQAASEYFPIHNNEITALFEEILSPEEEISAMLSGIFKPKKEAKVYYKKTRSQGVLPQDLQPFKVAAHSRFFEKKGTDEIEGRLHPDFNLEFEEKPMGSRAKRSIDDRKSQDEIQVENSPDTNEMFYEIEKRTYPDFNLVFGQVPVRQPIKRSVENRKAKAEKNFENDEMIYEIEGRTDPDFSLRIGQVPMRQPLSAKRSEENRKDLEADEIEEWTDLSQRPLKAESSLNYRKSTYEIKREKPLKNDEILDEIEERTDPDFNIGLTHSRVKRSDAIQVENNEKFYEREENPRPDFNLVFGQVPMRQPLSAKRSVDNMKALLDADEILDEIEEKTGTDFNLGLTHSRVKRQVDEINPEEEKTLEEPLEETDDGVLNKELPDFNLRFGQVPIKPPDSDPSLGHRHGKPGKAPSVDPITMFLTVSLPIILVCTLLMIFCIFCLRPRGTICKSLFKKVPPKKKTDYQEYRA